MKHFLRAIFGLALVVAMMIPASLVASAAESDIEVNGFIVDTGTRYHITYDANGGTGGCNGPDAMPGHADTVLSPEDTDLEHDGYRFTGWNTKADGSGTVYDPGDTVTLNGDITLYAQWEELPYSDPPDTGNEPKQPGNTGQTTTPKTGDYSNMALWAGMLLTSLTMILLLLWMDRRKRNRNEMQES